MTDEELLWIIKNTAEMNETYLDLRDNRLVDVLPEIGRLTHPTELYLSQNILNDLRPELFQLTNLIELHLSDNQMNELPPEICQLINLKELHLGSNLLTELPSEIFFLTDLTVLNLNNNQISELSPEICQLNNLEELRLDGNPLTSPPMEIAKQGIEAIRQYFASLEQEEQPLNEVKMILVGEGAAGKTSLVKKLFGEAFDPDEDSTHGIRISDWHLISNNKTIKLVDWSMRS